MSQFWAVNPSQQASPPETTHWDASSNDNNAEPVSSRIPISPSACRLLSRFILGADHNSQNNMSADGGGGGNAHYTNAVPDEKAFNPYLGIIAGGFFFFTVVHYFTGYIVPESAGSTRKAQWKWRNVCTSLTHSALTGAWALAAFYLDPSMCDDMIYAYTHSAHALVSFSIGYFVYDFFDMWLYNPKRSTYELLLHHACVVTCFGIAASTRMYLPYASLALVVEINSVFLHLRQLFIIQGYPAKTSMTYRNVALLNVATFVLFRILLLGWMTRWITVNRDNVPLVFFTAGSVGLATIITMNAVLFYRILNKDFMSGGSAPSSGGVQVRASALIKEQAKTGFHPVTKDVKNIMRTLFEANESGDEEEETTSKTKAASSLTKRKPKKVE